MARGVAVPRPFNLRWMLPWSLRNDERAWRRLAVAGALLTALACAGLCPNWETGLAAGVMFVALPSTRFNLRHPILVDLPAMGFAAAAAYISTGRFWYMAIPLVLFAGACKETAPIFAAAWVLNPLLLVGLIAPLIALIVVKTGPDPIPSLAWIQQKPFKAGRDFHKGMWLSGMMLAPWGGAIVGLANLDGAAIVSLSLAYGQLIAATDTVRLYQWAAPALLVCAVTAVPKEWLPVLVAWTIWNPLGSEGV